MRKWQGIVILLEIIVFVSFSHVWAENDLEPLPFPDTLCSMDFHNADIKGVLTGMAKAHDLNIILSGEVQGTISCSFKDITLSDAFQIIIQNAGLNYTVRENIVEVDTLQKKNEKLEELKKIQENTEKASPLVTKTYTLRYGINPRETIAKEIIKGKEIKDLDELVDTLKERLSKREGAKVTAINRTNTLIITDIPENVERLLAIIKQLDTPPKQIAIEAEIVEIDTAYARSIGVEWGGLHRAGEFALTGGVDSGTGVTTSGATRGDEVSLPPASGGVGLSGWNYAVNFPASISGESPASFAFMIGEIEKRVLDIQLSALQTEGKAKILTEPKVITQDNQRAYVTSGTEIPVQVQYPSAPGIVTFTVEYKNAAIELEVTPHVVDEGIYLDVIVAKKEPDFANERPFGIPIDTRSITTKVLIKDGTTLAIGGLVNDKEVYLERRTPLLSSIPILGWLFKSKTKTIDSSELMILITPRILENEEA